MLACSRTLRVAGLCMLHVGMMSDVINEMLYIMNNDQQRSWQGGRSSRATLVCKGREKMDMSLVTRLTDR